jgi:hypothetical protein
VVLVQGDTGPGNFMYAGGRVVAVVDWELAHLGDPMDDIAWLTLRATQEPFPDLPARVGEYEALSGHAIDEPRVRYYQVMAEAKLQVMAHRSGGALRLGRGGRAATSATASSTARCTAASGSRPWQPPSGSSSRRPSQLRTQVQVEGTHGHCLERGVDQHRPGAQHTRPRAAVHRTGRYIFQRQRRRATPRCAVLGAARATGINRTAGDQVPAEHRLRALHPSTVISTSS